MDDKARRVRVAWACIAALAATLAVVACDPEPAQPVLPDTPPAPAPPAAAAPPATPVQPAVSIPPTLVPQPAPTAPAPPFPTPAPAPSPLGPEIGAAVSFGGCDFFLEVANSPETRAVGLMGRESLGHDRGMLFVFEREQVLGFWMKNTLIPLDIIFIDSELTVVDVQTMRPEHETAPDLPVYTSAAPALYAIEVNERRAAECGIEPGDTVTLVNLMPGVSS